MFTYHQTPAGSRVAEVEAGSVRINSAGDMLDLIANANYFNGSHALIVHASDLHPDFFDLKTKIAGEILQKFSNYRMKLAIVGDFSGYTSKALRDFIRESNERGTVCFVGTVEEAVLRL
jgi:hypothetical protein